ENLRAELDKDTGKIRAFAVKAVVESPEQIEDPNLQITVDDARKLDPNVEVGGSCRFRKRLRASWAASPHNSRSKSSFKKSVRPSATPFTTSTSAVSARS